MYMYTYVHAVCQKQKRLSEFLRMGSIPSDTTADFSARICPTKILQGLSFWGVDLGNAHPSEARSLPKAGPRGARPETQKPTAKRRAGSGVLLAARDDGARQRAPDAEVGVGARVLLRPARTLDVGACKYHDYHCHC